MLKRIVIYRCSAPLIRYLFACVSIDYRVVPGSFPNPVVSVGVCYTAVYAAAGGLTTGWWAVVLECFSSHLLVCSSLRTIS